MNFLIKKFSHIILIISFLLLIYIFYKSEIVWNGSYRNYYKTYYLIFLISICISIISFYISNKIKQYLIIFGISSILSLYLFEGYLTFKQLAIHQLYKKKTGNNWDIRTLYEIYSDFKKIDNDIEIVAAPINYVFMQSSITPLSGISNKKTINCNENGYYSIYQSDRYGFNNPDSEWDLQEIEYLLVGDSFTHGSCVNRPNDISSVLRNLSNKSVLNLGYRGNGPLIEYATLREYLDKKVKKIIWVYYEGNDLIELKDEIINATLINYLKNLNFTQNLKFKQNEINDLATNIIRKGEKKTLYKEKSAFMIKLKKFIKIFNTRDVVFKVLKKPSKPEVVPEFRRIIQLLKELTNKNNSKLYFVYLPEYNRYKTSRNNKDYNLVKNIVDELNIPFIDIHKEVFEKEQNPLKLFPFEVYRHYNIAGYKKVAQTIYQFTKD